MLSSICAQAKSLGVAGTHGKTTTTSMLMLILAAAGLRPSFIIGGDVTDMGTGAQWTGGEWLVVEADESDGTHLELPLFGTILTNVEVDHLDFYGTEEAIVAGFDQYLAQVAGPKVLCVDDPVCAELAERHGAITYGTSPAADYRAVDVRADHGSYSFTVEHAGRRARHRRSAVARYPQRAQRDWVRWRWLARVGVDFDVAARALAKFGGVARRFDIRGVDGGAALVDDYAHLPSEISAVLSAARSSGDGWRRVVAVFQPNRFNRMAVMSPALPRCIRRRRPRRDHRHLRRPARHRFPASPGKLVVNAVLDAHPDDAAGVDAAPRRSDRVPRPRTARRRCLHLDGLRRHRLAARRGAATPSRAAVRVEPS